jgi:hypothetical protein
MIVLKYVSIWQIPAACVEIIHAAIILVLALLMGICIFISKYWKWLRETKLIEPVFRFLIDRVCWKRIFVTPRFERYLHVQCRFISMVSIKWNNALDTDSKGQSHFLVRLTTTRLKDYLGKVSHDEYIVTDGTTYYSVAISGDLQPSLRDPFHFLTVNEVRAIQRELTKIITAI